MGYQLPEELHQAISDARDAAVAGNGKWAAVYDIVYAEINGKVDESLAYWFQMAREINRNDPTPVAQFIRAYTKESFHLSGIELTETDLQQMSDDIAEAVITDIINRGFYVPDLTDIIQNDVAGSINFNDANLGTVVWGGTPFAESKLDFQGWLDGALQSDEDYEIYLKATFKACAVATGTAIETFDFGEMFDADAVGACTSIFLQMQYYLEEQSPEMQQEIYHRLHSELDGFMRDVATGGTLAAIDPQNSQLPDMVDSIQSGFLSNIRQFADIVSESLSPGATDLALAYGLPILIGTGSADTIVADNKSNWIFAGAGDDVLAGGIGDDVLDGGAGNDELRSSEGPYDVSWHSDPGQKTYVWGPGYGHDRVIDWSDRNYDANFRDIGVPGEPTIETDRFITNVSRVYLPDLTADDVERLVLSHAGYSGIYMLRIKATGETLVIQGRVYLEFGDGTRLWEGESIDPDALWAEEIYVGDLLAELQQPIPAEGPSFKDIVGSANPPGWQGDPDWNLEFNGIFFDGSQADHFRGGDGDDSFTPSGGSGPAVIGAGAGNDTVVGGDSDDALFGEEGDDVLTGGGGNDVLVGGDGVDTADYSSESVVAGFAPLYGGGVVVNLTTETATDAGGGRDKLHSIENVVGSSFDDTIVGNDGANLIIGGAGDDAILGGGGTDTVSFVAASSGVSVDLGAGTAVDGDGGFDSLSEVENVVGSTYDDVIAGDGQANVLVGGAGHDTLIGGGGNDTADYASSLAGVAIDLGSGTASDGYWGQDSLTGIENVTGSSFDDSIAGDDQNNLLIGGDGNDSLDGGIGADTVIGGAGNDILVGGAGTDTLSYVAAQQQVIVDLVTGTATDGQGGVDSLSGFEDVVGSIYNDTIAGDNGANTLVGGFGDDTMSGRGGDDVLNGGLGEDTVSYAAMESTAQLGGVLVDLVAGTAATPVEGTDTLIGIEHVIGSSFGDTLLGDALANVLSGGAGDDLLAGGVGNDTLTGGSGNDTASYAGAAWGVVVSLSAGAATNDGDGSTDTLSSIENVFGSAFGDSITGNSSANVLRGGAGSDTLNGGSGSDTADYATASTGTTINLSAGSGQDGDGGTDTLVSIENVNGSAFADSLTGDGNANRLSGGGGNDVLDGGGGIDTASYASAASGVAVSLASGTAAMDGDGGVDSLTGMESVTGSNFNDALTGDAGANVLSGLGGDDVVIGGGGNDTLAGGAGFDTADYSAASAAVTVNLGSGSATDGDGGTDSLSSIERVVGSSANDSLTGDTNANVLLGGDGNDTLVGRGGVDTLVGGGGIDTVSYASAAAGVAVDLSIGVASSDGDGASDSLSTIEHATGSAFADTIAGDGGANQLDGGGGNDLLRGGAGNDLLIGGAGIDAVSYALAASGATVDLSLGEAANDGDGGVDILSAIENIIGSSFSDVLTGDANANTLEGGSGNDALSGAAGIDRASYASAASGINADLSTGVVADGDGGVDSLTGIENLTGSAFADVIVGDGSSNVLDGGAGDDVLIGRGGTDNLNGGDGTDTASYVTAAVAVTASLIANSATVDGDGGTDTFLSIENLIGSDFDDSLTGNGESNVLEGGGGSDILNGRGGSDVLIGGTGADTASYISATSGVAVNLVNGTAVDGEGGTDALSGIENVTGSGLDDVIIGDAASNLFASGAGNDVLQGGGGNDTLDGGTELDTASYAGAAAGVVASLASGLASDDGDGGVDTLTAIENLTGSSFSDQLTGSAAANTLVGSGGSDTLDGGAGNDIVSYVASTAGVAVDLEAGVATDGMGGVDSLMNFEDVIGSAYDDSITGDSAANVLYGRGGNDVLDGGAGTDRASYAFALAGVVVDLSSGIATDDGEGGSDALLDIEGVTGSSFGDSLIGDSTANTIDGGDGDDLLAGGDGNDTLVGGGGLDTVSYAGASAAVSVSLTAGTANDGSGGTDVLSGIENVVGSGWNDSITGNGSANHLSGGAGSDTLDGGAGIDTAAYGAAMGAVTVSLGTGTATSDGDGGTDTLVNIENVDGSDFDDSIVGSSGANVLFGDSGDDTLVGRSGNDTLIGGTGTDTADYSAAAAAAIINLTSGTGADGEGGTDTLSEVENLIGTGFNDTLTGDLNGNDLDGAGGNDTLVGRGGNDILRGGAGTDTASYAAAVSGVTANLLAEAASDDGEEGIDTLIEIENLVGSAFGDTLVGGADANVIEGGGGNDTLSGRGGNDTLNGGAGSDTVSLASAIGATTTNLTTSTVSDDGEGGTDTLVSIENVLGSAYDDAITGGNGANILDGGNGDDLLEGRGGNDFLNGGQGLDTISFASAISGAEIFLYDGLAYDGAGGTDTLEGIEDVVGSAFDDSVYGDAGDNYLGGGAGDDYLEGRAGNDVLDGGAGIDTVSYAGAAAGITASLAIGNCSTDGDGSSDTFLGVENLAGSSFGDSLTGDGASNRISGEDGDDIIVGGAGDDELDGGGGGDLVSYVAAAAAVVVDLSDGIASDGDGGSDVLISIENVRGSSFGDSLSGSDEDNIFEGGAGDDALIGRDGSDTASYSAASTGVSVDLETGSASDGDGGTDTLDGIENVRGSAFDDTLVGNDESNVLDGGAGDDLLVASAFGQDTLIGGDGIDTVDYSGAAGTVVFRMGPGIVERADGGTDFVLGVENAIGSAFDDALYGAGGANALYGGNGNDSLHGGEGDDQLDGGSGNDTLEGGAGNDTYVLDAGYGEDVILDAGGAADRIEFLSGISTSSITFSRTGVADGDLLIEVDGAAPLTLTVQDQFADAGRRIETFHFSDGTELSWQDVEDLTSTSEDDTLIGTPGDDVLDGGVGNDTLIGDAGNDVLLGGEGNDTLQGDAGDDTLDGGPGDDTMAGGTGDDTYLIDSIGDVVTEAEDEGFDSIESAISYTLGDNVEALELAGSGDLDGMGNALDNALTGNSGENTLTGGAGNDFLDGAAGADTLVGGVGDDTYVVDDSGDAVTEEASEGTDTVRSAIAYTLGSNLENLTLIGTSDIGGTGNALANVITGNAGANVLSGDSGDDILEGGAGADALDGGIGADTLSYAGSGAGVTVSLTAGTASGGDAAGDTWTSIENLAGSAYGDSLTGDTNANTLTGGGGNDLLDGGAGNDTLIGGLGDDTYVVGSAGDAVTEAADQGTDTVQSSVSYTLGSNVENLTLTGSSGLSGTGNALDNVLTGNSSANTLTGGDGNDFLDGGAGNDTLIGGQGDDTYVVNSSGDEITESAGQGIDTVRSSIEYALDGTLENLILTGTSSIDGTGNGLDNVIEGNSGANTLVGGGGNDTLIGGAGNDELDGGSGNDVLYGGDGNDVMDSGEGNDTLDGGAGDDEMTGRDGNDLLIGGAGADAMEGRGGTDTASYAFSGAGVTVNLASGTGSGGDAAGDTLDTIENLTGSAHDDTLTGDGNANTLDGAAGNDVLDGGSGNDTLIGGLGNDVFVVNATGDVVTEAADEGTDTVQSSVSWTLGANVENLTLTGSSGLSGTGNDLDNVLTGNSGANTLTGGAGNDLLDGGTGNDTMIGGLGNDTYVVNVAGDVVTEAADEGTDTVQSGVSYTLGSNVENLTLTGTSGLSGTGNALDNVLTGNAGANTLSGGAGDDTLEGGAGADALNGGTWVDTASYVGSSAAVTVNLTTGAASGGDAAGDTFSNIESLTGSAFDDSLTGDANENVLSGGAGNDTLSGYAEDDVLLGEAGNDTLDGGSGRDTLDGGSGDDTMAGGLGGDTYFVDSAGDVVVEAAGEGRDTVESTISYTLGDNVEDLIMRGTVDFVGTGNALDNLIGGDLGNDTLHGGAGDDNLFGWEGDDYLDGGDGNDSLGGNVGNDTSYGGDGDDYLIDSLGDDYLDGGAGDDRVEGGPGSDTLIGGLGNDTYVFLRGHGEDLLDNTDAGASTDVAIFDGFEDYIDVYQLWFTRTGDDLTVSLIGTEDSVTVQGWYADSTKQLDEFRTTDVYSQSEESEEEEPVLLAPAMVLEASEVEQLRSAMAAFNPPPLGQLTLSQEVRDALEPTITSTWSQAA